MTTTNTTTAKTFTVTYTKKIGTTGTILVKARNEKEAIGNAKGLCATGSDFRDAVETKEKYNTPRNQGFQGFN